MKLFILSILALSSYAYPQSDVILNLDKDNLQVEKKRLVELETKIKESTVTKEIQAKLLAIKEEKLNILDKETFLSLRENEDRKILDANGKYLNCDENTPELSLEEKVPYPGASFPGPFYEVARDNQGAFATCYANTAKNLLVGTSKGEDVASFLDLALVSKGEKGVVTSGLKAGESCSVLKKMQQTGYCPQTYAPLENGENNIYVQGLLGATGSSVYYQRVIIDLLHEFLAGQFNMNKKNKILSEKMVKQAKLIIQQIKLRPNVKIPLPVVNSQIPGQWKLKGFLNINKNINKDQFLADYHHEYRHFYPQYIRAVIEGKGRDEIFELFQEKMRSFISKYQMSNQLPAWKIAFLEDTESDWSHPKLKENLADSVAFLKAISGKENASKEDFLKFCDETFSDSYDSLNFLNTLRPLVKHLNSVKVNTDILLDDKGVFKSPTELMQLAVAPACVNQDKRVRPKDKILCQDGIATISLIRAFGKTPEAQTKMMRERVLASLLQGYALGNSTSGHINTIVGMRFNHQTNVCEIKIRESQSGTSFWKTEQSVFTEINGLTEVRRQP